MFAEDDTIVAIATPAGRGGLGVVRISGPSAAAIARTMTGRRKDFEARHATFTRVRGPAGVLDEVVVTLFPAPHSYTGEDVVEIGAHGSPVVLRALVRLAQEAGARLARPGEFTLRAFLNGRRDLVQAEAVADLIDAVTPLQARLAGDQLHGALTRRLAAIEQKLFDLIARLEASLDFPDEGYHYIDPSGVEAELAAGVEAIDALLCQTRRGRLIREGATVVVAGRPNVGKSSLFNALAGGDRAIVSATPGTTRDLIAERVEVEGLALTIVDTAGSREPEDAVEREGVVRAAGARAGADLVLVVLDGSVPITEEDRRLLAETDPAWRIVVVNKCDLPSAWTPWEEGLAGAAACVVSAQTGAGFADLRRVVAERLSGGEPVRDSVAISNLRHVRLLEEARADLMRAAAAAARGDVPEEFLLSDLQAARARFDEIVGRRTDEDLLRHIFERFCIGK
jgi:tRNA modification GTPase